MLEGLTEEWVLRAVDAGAHRAVDGALERQHVRLCLDRLITACRLQMDSTANAIAHLCRMRGSGPDHLDTGFLQVLAQAIEQSEGEHGWRQRRDFENRAANLLLESRMHLHVVRQAEHRRHADANAPTLTLPRKRGRERARCRGANATGHLLAKARVFETAGNVDRRHQTSWLESREGDADGPHPRSVPTPRPREIRRREFGHEVLVAVEAAEDDRIGTSQITGGHRIGHQAARLGRAGRGGKEKIAIQAALPAEAGLFQPLDQQTSPLTQRRQSGARVWMVRMITDQLGDTFPGVVDRIRCRRVRIAKHVDSGVYEIDRRQSRPDQHRLAPRFLQAARRDQCREPRADDGDVEFHRYPLPDPPRKGEGGVSTPSREREGGVSTPSREGEGEASAATPSLFLPERARESDINWRSRLKSSMWRPAVTCAWRSWLPQKTCRTPRQRVSRKSAIARVATGPSWPRSVTSRPASR